MLAIKNFIEKISYLEGRAGGSVDYRMTLPDAKLLRDELSKLLADYYTLANKKEPIDDVIKVEISGGKF